MIFLVRVIYAPKNSCARNSSTQEEMPLRFFADGNVLTLSHEHFCTGYSRYNQHGV